MASGTANKLGSFLSPGVIASHLEHGQTQPRDRAVFRILGTKALLDKKYRFTMTDEVNKYNQGMIVLRDGDKLPEKGDVVDLGIKSQGASKNKMVIQDNRNILVAHYIRFVNNTANGKATSDPTTPSTSSGELERQPNLAKGRSIRGFQYPSVCSLEIEWQCSRYGCWDCKARTL
jgi:hypothetical protein